MFCENCGQELQGDAIFCIRCGRKVDASEGLPLADKGLNAEVKASADVYGDLQTSAKTLPNAQVVKTLTTAHAGQQMGKPKALKITFFSLLGLVGVLFIVLVIVLLRNPVGKISPVSLISEDPKVDLKALAEWDEDVFSLDGIAGPKPGEHNVQTAAEPTEANESEAINANDALQAYPTPVFETNTPMYSVLTESAWSIAGTASNPNHLGAADDAVVLDQVKNKIKEVIFYPDNTLDIIAQSEEQSDLMLEYEIMDIHFCESYLNEDGYGYRFYLGNDGLIYMCLYGSGENAFPDISDFLVFAPASSDLGEKSQPVNNPLPDELVNDISGYLGNSLWVSNGAWLDNPNAAAAASGYPKQYTPEYGEIQYQFYENGIVEISILGENGEVSESTGSDSLMDPYGFYLYAFHRTQMIDGVEHQIYSAFFASGQTLYEVEMLDDQEVSNYIQYVLYEP